MNNIQSEPESTWRSGQKRKTSSPLSQDKLDVLGQPVKGSAPVKTKQQANSYIMFRKLFKAPKKIVQFAVIAAVGLFAAYVPPALVHSSAPKTPASIAIVSAWGSSNIDVWWPTDGTSVTGQQPFKAVVNNQTLDTYKMVWQVDGGQQNEMQNSFQDYPHKESLVDLTGWNWKGSGPYTISFTAFDFSGNAMGTKYETIYINGLLPGIQTAASQTPQAAPTVAPAVATNTTVSNPTPIAATFVSQTAAAAAPAKLDVWWPTTGTTISGITPFKVMLENNSVSDYSAYWQVDGGQLNAMASSYQDYPHKESLVDLTGWNWKGSGPYTITFIAKNTGDAEIARTSVTITIGKVTTSQQLAVPAIQTALTQPAVQTSSGNVFSGAKFYVNPNSDPANWVKSHQGDPNVSLMQKVASGAESEWFGDWNSNVQGDVNNVISTVTKTGALPIIVAYDIPNRDCGGYSSGGASPDAYKQWIAGMAAGINGRKTAVILEPDATALTNCLSSADLQTRYSLLKYAVSSLKAVGASVYIDAGHSGWIDPSDMAGRLKQAGIDQADGFSLNVSNFETTDSSNSYGQQISALLGGKHFVVDTSRNGSGPTSDAQWCNPSGRSLGQKPTASTGNSLVDAYLWVKGPGGSDGNCNGGPSAGVFWPDYAVGLALRASW